MSNKSAIVELAHRLTRGSSAKTLDTCRRVRAIHHHTFIVDTTKALYVWEHGNYPTLYVPQGDLQNCDLRDKQDISSEGRALVAVAELVVPSRNGDREARVENVLRFSTDNSLGTLAGMVRIQFGSIGMFILN